MVQYETRGDVAVVTLDDERHRNSLSAGLVDELEGAFATASEGHMSALLLRSSGRVFCAGGDLSGLSRALDTEGQAGVSRLVDQFHTAIRLLRSLPLVTVASLNGGAIGGGIALAMACDVRIAGLNAYFATGYLAVGATPDGGASFHLARALGEPRALASLLLNSRFPAEELLRLGLVDQLVHEGDADPVALSVAEHVALISPEALLAARSLVYGASEHSLDVHLDSERDLFIEVSETDGFRSGIAQFAGNGNSNK